jgi:capsular exopolysaccharide synthesis family protein
MELRDYLAVLRRRKWLIAGVTAVAVAVAAASTLAVRPEYTGTATLRIEASSALVGGQVRTDDLSYLDRLENTYADLAKSTELRDEVAQRVGLARRPDVEVHAIANTELMNVRVTTTSPQSAAKAANALAAALVARIRALTLASSQEAERLYNERADQLEEEIAVAEETRTQLALATPSDANRLEIFRLREEITSKRTSLAALRADHQTLQLARQARAAAISVVAQATPPTRPSNRHLPLALALGLALGLIAALGLALVAENLTRRFRTRDEIEDAVQAPILATIPDVRQSASSAIFDHGSRASTALKRLAAPFGVEAKQPHAAAVFNSGSSGEEAFRRLATALLAAGARRAFKIVLITSASPGEGKTTVVANVGRALAQSGRAVLLVDANLRSPQLDAVYAVPNERGLSDMLVPAPSNTVSPSGAEPEPPITPTAISGLWVLPSGNAVRDPAMLLGSPQMENWIGSVARGFDYVIFDSPAVLAVSDAATLARSVDAVLLVTSPDIDRGRLEEAHRELHALDVRFLGVVVNKTFGQREKLEFSQETHASAHGVHE